MIDGITQPTRNTCLDLDNGTLALMFHKQIDLATPDANIAVQQPDATILQETNRDGLTETAQLPRAQIAEVGSSSSMLTSRNVITFTLLTNRAGRYISHTHASFNSSSK